MKISQSSDYGIVFIIGGEYNLYTYRSGRFKSETDSGCAGHRAGVCVRTVSFERAGLIIDNRVKIKLVIFVVLSLMVALLTVALVIRDNRRSDLAELRKAQREYMQAILDMQARKRTEKTGAEAVTFEDAKEGLPKVAKKNFKP